MSYKQITLITTVLSKFSHEKKNKIFLGEWCHSNHKNNFNNLKEGQTMKHHWCGLNKRLKDVKYLEKNYEKILREISVKLNKIYKVKKNLRYWRIIIGPWLHFYIVSMFDRWENLRIFFKKYHNTKKKTYYFKTGDDIFYNSDTADYVNKILQSDLWNHNNYLRIIKFQYLQKIILEKKNNVKPTIDYKNKKPHEVKNILSLSFLWMKLFHCLDFIFSYFGIRYNKVIIDSSYFSKINQLKLFIKLKIIPSFYSSTFKDISFKPKECFDMVVRDKVFKNKKKLKDPFINYLYFAMKTDFPVVFLEKFNDVQKSNSRFNKLKKKLIITSNSYQFNERFQMWAAEMITKGAKLHIAAHGGFLPFKIETSFDHHITICDKYLTWRLAKEDRWKKKRVKLSPVQLLKNKNLTLNQKKSCLILSFSVARHSLKLNSFPYAEQYKPLFENTCKVVKNLNPLIRKEVIYRCTEADNSCFRTIKKFSQKFKETKTQETSDTLLRDELKKTKLIINIMPETTVSDSITSNIPTVIIFPKKLFHLTRNSEKILDDLKKNNIYFNNPLEASKHINKIWHNPDIWWKSASTQKCLEKLKKFAFNIKDDWLDEWTNHIKQSI